jgi:predicted transcriptional regulator
MQFSAQGYTQREIGRLLGVSQSTVKRDIERTRKRIAAEDTKQWRQVQLLRLERLLEACQSVLDAHHVVVSNGHVVQQKVLDEEGKPIWDTVYGPDGEPVTNDDGQVRVEMRMVPLEDHGAVLEAVAEMRKIEAEIAKLLGTQTAVKQAVEVAHVDYTINGVDLDAVLGVKKPGDD